MPGIRRTADGCCGGLPSWFDSPASSGCTAPSVAVANHEQSTIARGRASVDGVGLAARGAGTDLGVFLSGADELDEEWVRLVGLALELGVELAADEQGMIG